MHGKFMDSFFSKSHGLHLILDQVVENGPAWESGVRPGDVIVTVNDWLIVLMDRPQVGTRFVCLSFDHLSNASHKRNRRHAE